MSVIAAAAMRCKTMADGSLRIEVEVSPMDAQDAFVLFGKPGTQMGLAALKDGYGAVGANPIIQNAGEQKDVYTKTSIGPLCKLAVQWCKDPEFMRWLSVTSEEDASNEIKRICQITSRRDLDTDKNACVYFDVEIRRPYMQHLKSISENK